MIVFEAFFGPCRIWPDKNQELKLSQKVDKFLSGPRRALEMDRVTLVLGFGSASCNASNWRASFSGYSGSVWGCLDLLGRFYTQQWAGAEDGKGIRPAAGTGNEWEEINWLPACVWYAQVGCRGFESWTEPKVEPVCSTFLGHFPSKSNISWRGL